MMLPQQPQLISALPLVLSVDTHIRLCSYVVPDALEVRQSQLEMRFKLCGIDDSTSSAVQKRASSDEMFRVESKIAALADKLDPVGAAALGSVSKKDFRVCA